MQQIVVDLIVAGAGLFIVRLVYRSVVSSRRAKQAACPGCGACEAAQKDPVPAAHKR